MELLAYRQSASERQRTADLLGRMPRNRHSVLDVGARDGYFSKLLTDYFQSVTALDLISPEIDHPRVTSVSGDVTRLTFQDGQFDSVFCAEVLEHIPDLEQACSEIARVAKRDLIIGVPYRQDTRLGRTTCQECTRVNPPWGHINVFTESRLEKLFPGFEPVSTSYVGESKECTNQLSTWLMDVAGNPWGTYSQDEPCVYCGSSIGKGPGRRNIGSRFCGVAAVLLNQVQSRFAKPHSKWVHVVYSRQPVVDPDKPGLAK